MKTRTSPKAPTALVAPDQSLEGLAAIIDGFLRVLIWGLQAGAATAYLLTALQPAAWHNTFAKDPFGAICMMMIGPCMVFLWGMGLWGESKDFYDRRAHRLHRKTALLGHLGALLIAVLAAVQLPHRTGSLIFLGTVSFCALTTWPVWMQSRFLPKEDQAVIDIVLSQEAAKRTAVFDASEREKRRRRLSGIVASLGYELIDDQSGPSRPAETPRIKWTIPAGKHKPLVYFIRNGNRMKIGTTVELKRRIRTLALRAENVALLVDGGQNVERQFHKQFAEHRIGNTEWFAYDGSLADYVHDETSRALKKEKGQ